VAKLSDNNQINPEFRLLLVTAESTALPSSIIQNSIKMIVENTGDIKQMLLNSYQNESDSNFSISRNPELYKRLFFSVSLFHALIIDRMKFGPIGFTT